MCSGKRREIGGTVLLKITSKRIEKIRTVVGTAVTDLLGEKCYYL